MTFDQRTLDRLRLHPSSWSVDEEGLLRIATHTKYCDVRAGGLLQHAGEPVTSLLLVVRGRLKLTLDGPDGRKQTIRYLTQGDQFGLLSLSQEIILPVDVVAEVDSDVLSISASDAKQLANEVPMWKRNLTKLFGGSLQGAFLGDRRRSRPQTIAILHDSPMTREVAILPALPSSPPTSPCQTAD